MLLWLATKSMKLKLTLNCIGTGTEVAIEAADITILGGDLLLP